MIAQNSVQLFQSESRGRLESKAHCCFAVFNFEHYFEESRKAVGVLDFFNEEILAAQHCVKRMVDKTTALLLLPLFGGIDYKDSSGNKRFIGVEQIGIIAAEKGSSYEISNGYQHENVSFLAMGFNADVLDFGRNYKPSHFDLSQKNQLISLFDISNAWGFIGIYEGRKEGFYTLKRNGNAIFVFIISGVFEIENRLVASKDGIRLSGIGSFSWEALSESALFVVLEIP